MKLWKRTDKIEDEKTFYILASTMPKAVRAFDDSIRSEDFNLIPSSGRIEEVGDVTLDEENAFGEAYYTREQLIREIKNHPQLSRLKEII